MPAAPTVPCTVERAGCSDPTGGEDRLSPLDAEQASKARRVTDVVVASDHDLISRACPLCSVCDTSVE
ncbi:hypothetical protein Ssi02_34380 [Sinosporangium siamense]|uniref:Uncharacterized protein n=1 Tax=Sinosporangium siamense TaxID=1367973 RepID=A0A919RH07_9ACTN|nr:hypothetical protein Ssi02_34380 [Sinosporangium siamense]